MVEFDFIRASKQPVQSIYETYIIGAYELGSTLRNFYYDRLYGTGYAFDMQAEFADFVSILRMLCQQSSIAYDEMVIVRSLGTTIKVPEGLWIGLYRSYASLLLPLVSEELLGCLVWIRRVCYYYSWELLAIEKLGEERYLERQKDIVKYGRT
jgi:hypothetical protein